jgi:hypothetical protein
MLTRPDQRGRGQRDSEDWRARSVSAVLPRREPADYMAGLLSCSAYRDERASCKGGAFYTAANVASVSCSAHRYGGVSNTAANAAGVFCSAYGTSGFFDKVFGKLLSCSAYGAKMAIFLKRASCKDGAFYTAANFAGVSCSAYGTSGFYLGLVGRRPAMYKDFGKMSSCPACRFNDVLNKWPTSSAAPSCEATKMVLWGGWASPIPRLPTAPASRLPRLEEPVPTGAAHTGVLRPRGRPSLPVGQPGLRQCLPGDGAWHMGSTHSVTMAPPA